jgi:hypothetical protein
MLQVVVVGEFEDLDALVQLLAHLSNPLVGLALWIDIEWPSAGLVGNDGVLNGEGVLRKAIDAPVSDLDCITEYSCKTEDSTVRNLLLFTALDPLIGKIISEYGVEGT